MTAKKTRSYRFSEACKARVRRIGEKLGLKDTVVFELAVLCLEEREFPQATPKKKGGKK